MRKPFKERKPGKHLNKQKTLTWFKKTLLYFFLALQLYLCITIVVVVTNNEYTGITSKIMIARFVLGFIITCIINWVSGARIRDFFFTEDRKKHYFYSKKDRKVGMAALAVTTILFFTVIICFTVTSLDLL